MLRWIHGQLVKFPLTRGPQRRLARRLKQLLGCPDAYGDLVNVCRKARPAAVLDVGAFEGETVLKFLDELPGVPIHAFEPTPAPAAVLRRRMKPFSNVSVHQCALADKTGTLTFHLNAAAVTNSLLENASCHYRPFEEAQAHRRQLVGIDPDQPRKFECPQGTCRGKFRLRNQAQRPPEIKAVRPIRD